jgi:hypothetical protein
VIIDDRGPDRRVAWAFPILVQVDHMMTQRGSSGGMYCVWCGVLGVDSDGLVDGQGSSIVSCSGSSLSLCVWSRLMRSA